MKKLLLASFALIAPFAAHSAQAADAALPPYKAPPPAIVYSWTGCYIGVHGGGGWSPNDWFVNLPGNGEYGVVRASGFVAGGQVGCDYQIGTWVFGIEGLYSWANMKGQTLAGFPSLPIPRSRIDGLALATGRVGYAFDHALLYVKAGFAWAHDKHQLDLPLTAFTPALIGSAGVVGWTAGGGIEVAFLPNWSWKVEYNYLGFSSNGFDMTCLAPVCGGAASLPFDIRQSVQTVIFGLNYRFGPGAVVAKY